MKCASLAVLATVVAVLGLASAARAQVEFNAWALPPGVSGFDRALISNDGVIHIQPQDRLLGQDRVFVPLNVPPGFVSSRLLTLNHQGFGAGSVSDGSMSTAAIRSPDGAWSLPMPGVPSTAHGVSSAGAVVGMTTLWGPNRAFLFDAGSGATLISMPPGRTPRPLNIDITGSGLVFGTADAPFGPGAGVCGFRYTPQGGSVLLDTPPGQASEAVAANDAGVIVGVVGGLGNAVRAIKWLADGTPVELDTLSSGFVTAQGINNREDIVGSGFLAGPRALLWSDDFGAIDLNDLLTPQQRLHWELRIASDINDNRQIVGLAKFYPDGPNGPAPGVNHLFMLTLPHTPEPAIGAFLLLACALLRRRHHT